MLYGNLLCLLHSQHAVTLPAEHHLKQRIDEYPMLIYPEWDYVTPEMKKMLLGYVRRGGNLLIIGPQTTALFEEELGVELIGSPERTSNGLMHNNQIADFTALSQRVRLGSDVKAAGKYFRGYVPDRKNGWFDTPETETYGASVRQLGKGKIAGLYIDIGETYHATATPSTREYVNSVVMELFPEPLVRVQGSHYVDVQVMRNHGKLLVNLLNAGGPHDNPRTPVFDEIPPVGPLSISIRSPHKPERVTLQPGGQAIGFRYEEGRVLLALPTLHSHSVLVLEGPPGPNLGAP
jgi:hypothetical protein